MVKNYHFKKGSRAYNPRKRSRLQIPSISVLKKSLGVPPLICIKCGMTTAYDNTNQLVAATIMVPIPYEISDKGVNYGLISQSKNYDYPKYVHVKDGNFDGYSKVKKIVNIKYTPHKIKSAKRNKPIMKSWATPENYVKQKYQFEKVFDCYVKKNKLKICAVTTGKGFVGSIKRFGLRLKKRKHSRAGKTRHKGGGSRTPKKVLPVIPMPGGMGYTKRTYVGIKLINEYNAELLKKLQNYSIPNYGTLSKNILLLKGSIPGPQNRCVMIYDEL